MMDEQTEYNAGVTIPPPLIYVVPLLLGLIIQKFRHVSILPKRLARPLGAVFLLAGLATNIWGVRTMRGAGTSLNPTQPAKHLVTSGPFQFSRNPLYTGMTLIYLGITNLVNTIWPLIFLPAILLTMRRRVIAREEQYLERKFGNEYLEYKQGVRRWL
jgi:protein-S-isoprenylcysteine O-methyltransferase Ste14